ncbi:conserved hypothetical protein [Tenacibaculum dicentrarchi]|nr:conserved hypothetical protein [Tenacibaculum dicentrarchi]
MKIKNILSTLFFLAFITSCSEKKLKLTYYKYNNVTITRINNYPKDFFYYGEFTENNLPESYIKSEFSGRDGGMGAYIKFKEDNSVEIIRVYDNFEKIGLNPKLELKDEMSNLSFIEWRESIETNFKNVIYVSDVLKLEKKINEKGKTKVKVEYLE